jgi:hypothetical protein
MFTEKKLPVSAVDGLLAISEIGSFGGLGAAHDDPTFAGLPML